MVIDGNSYFKKASIKSLSNLELLDVFHQLRVGSVYFARRYLLTGGDLDFVSQIIRERVYIHRKGKM